MEDTFHINLGEYGFGPEELDLLLKEWLKDPQPKVINDIARLYLTQLIESEKGYLPYDRRRRYEEGDKIIIYSDEKMHPAQVIGVIRDYNKDHFGFTYEAIKLDLLDESVALAGHQTKSFIANYQGEELAGSGVTSFEIIKEKDETDVIPKILRAISSDNRFVNFQVYWLPYDLLVTDVSTKLNDVRKIIAKCKQALPIRDILEKVYAHNNKEKLGNRLELSLNYFLDNDKRERFKCLKDENSTIKWDLRKPSDSVQVTINERILSDSKLRTSSDLELLLFYNGFFDQCVFFFPYNREITAYHDISEGTISGEEFVNELAKLSENKEYKVRFEHPEHRGDPICASVPDEPKKIQSTVTIRQEWLADGVLKVPKRLSSYMKGTDAVHILYDQVEEELHYDEADRLIKGLNEFYSKKAIDAFDRVQLQLESVGPTRLFIHSSWKVSLDKLLRIEPQDLNWEQSSVRDCIIVVLAKFRTPAHYREIYTEIAIHKHISWGSIIGTLSRYSPSVFVHVGWGQWGLAGWAEQEENSKAETTKRMEIVEINNDVWKAVETIEENDYVYKLLQKIARPLSFDEICGRLASYLKVDVQALRATGFLKADDERLRRLDDGAWALEEWSASDKGQKELAEHHDEEIRVEETVSEDTSRRSRSWLLLLILLILLFSGMVVGGVLIWLFLYGR